MAEENVTGADITTDPASTEKTTPDNIVVTDVDINSEWDIPVEKSDKKSDGPDDKNKSDEKAKPAGPDLEKPESTKPDDQKPEDEVFKSPEELAKAYDKLKEDSAQKETFIQTLKGENKQFREGFDKKFNDLLAKLEANSTGSGKEPSGKEAKNILETYSKTNPAVAKALDGLTGTLGEADVAHLNTILTAISEDTNNKITQHDEKDQLRENTKLLEEAAERFPECKDPDIQVKINEFSEAVKDQENIDPALLADLPYHFARSKMMPKIVEGMVNKLLPERAMAEAKKMVASGAVVGVGPGSTKPGVIANLTKKQLDEEWDV